MDPSKQDAINSIENSVYKTAFKLRSVQTLCQLDVMDSSLIQQVLSCQSVGELRESSLSVQQLFQGLQELFQRTEAGKLGQVHPRTPELTLSLLMTMYDSSGSGTLKLRPVAAALVALSGDSPLTKYRALFQLYAENNKGSNDSRARMTRRVLRNLLTDLQQIPTAVGESCTLCPVESAIRSCFRGVLSSGIKEEKFLSWVQSEPLILLWLPTCYRLSAAETVTHPVRCSVCRSFPITGLRYRCLKCLNFDICQVCFLSGLHSKNSHTIIEHCVQMSTRENTKLLLRAMRDNLFQRRCRTEAMRRQWLLDQLAPEDITNHAQARLSIQYNSPKVPVYVRSARPVETAATECSKHVCQRLSHAQQANDSNSRYPIIVSIKNELWRTHESINVLHRKRRLLRKQLNRYKQKLQAMHTSQEEQSCRFERRIQELTTNQDSLWTKLQKMGRDLQAMLQPLHPSSSSQNMASKNDQPSTDNRLWRQGDSSFIKSVTANGSEWEPLPNSAGADGSCRNQATAKQALPNSEPPDIILQSTRAQSHVQKIMKESRNTPPTGQERLQDNLQISPDEMRCPVSTPSERKEIIHINERKDELEEEDLQELLSKLVDAFSQEMPSGLHPSFNVDLYGGAERVCRAFSALVDQITLLNQK